MKIFFTDTNSNLTESEARKMGVVQKDALYL